jgi:hypothetical protein
MKGVAVKELISLIIIFLLCGCGRNPLGPGGLVIFGVDQKGVSSFSPPYHTLSLNNSDYFLHITEIYFTIEKVEFTTDGEKWIEIFNGTMEMKATAGSSVDFYCDKSISIKPDEYQGIRIWVKKVKMKGILTDDTGKVIDIIERETDDGGTWPGATNDLYCNPRVFTTRNTRLAYPFVVKPHREIYIMLAVNGYLRMPFSSSSDYKPLLIIGGARVTEIKP